MAVWSMFERACAVCSAGRIRRIRLTLAARRAAATMVVGNIVCQHAPARARFCVLYTVYCTLFERFSEHRRPI